MKIGFFGLGNMGRPMAVNLVKAGFTVEAFDIIPEALEDFPGKTTTSISECSKDKDIIVTMLPNGKISKELYMGSDGILKHARSGCTLIDSSTIAASDAVEIANAAKSAGFSMIDAPVSGGVGGAIAGTLTFIVGGEKNALETARAVLSKMGANIFHAGDNGAGQVAKICNNMLLAIHMIGTSEALSLGVAHGLDAKVLSEIMKQSSGDNWSLQKYNPYPNVMETTPASNGYKGGFGSKLMLKDLNLSQEAVEATHSKTPLGKLAKDLYSKHCETQGDKDFSSIINSLK